MVAYYDDPPVCTFIKIIPNLMLSFTKSTRQNATARGLIEVYILSKVRASG